MRIVSHNDQALVVAFLGCLLARFALLGDTSLCGPPNEQKLVWLALIEVFACVAVWLVALKFDGITYAFHYLVAQLLFLALLHPFPFHAEWTFLPAWCSAVLIYVAWSFYIDCVPLYYRTVGTAEFTQAAYLRILNVANSICVNDVNVRRHAELPQAVRDLDAYTVQRDHRNRPKLVPTAITSMVRGHDAHEGDEYAGHEGYGGHDGTSGGSLGLRRRSSFDEEE